MKVALLKILRIFSEGECSLQQIGIMFFVEVNIILVVVGVVPGLQSAGPFYIVQWWGSI